MGTAVGLAATALPIGRARDGLRKMGWGAAGLSMSARLWLREAAGANGETDLTALSDGAARFENFSASLSGEE